MVLLITTSCSGVRREEHQPAAAPSAGAASGGAPAAVAGWTPIPVLDQAGWRPLFDGLGLEDWQMIGPGAFKREGGELVTHGGMGLLWYTGEKLGNCQIRVVFKLTAPGDNSGVFIRIPETPRNPWYAVNHGYEAQIANAGDAYHSAGSLYSLTQAKNTVTLPINEWSTMLITLDGPRTIVEVSGQLVTDFTEGDAVPLKQRWYEPERGPRPESGYIGLQNHDDATHVHYKEVSVRPLRQR